MKYKNIAISGKNIASGSTTLANKLTKKLGWKFYSAGEMFRQYCNEKGWPIERYKDVPDRVDIEVDEKAKKILETKEKIIYEGWLVGWISRDISHVFKILCTAPLKTRIKRFANRIQPSFLVNLFARVVEPEAMFFPEIAIFLYFI